jgi:flagellar hook capping protein FlgD
MSARRVGAAVALCATLVAWQSPARAAGYAITRSVLGNGAPSVAGLSGSGRKVFGTVGQTLIGQSSGSGRKLFHGFWASPNPPPVGVDDPPIGEPPPLPAELSFGRPSPNPGREAVSFGFALPRAASVELSVLDVQGRLVRTVVQQSYDAGVHVTGWDARDVNGRHVDAGVYFARLRVDGVAVGTRRVVLRP